MPISIPNALREKILWYAEEENRAATEKYPTTAIIGDCDKVYQISKPVREGFFAGWSIH